MKKLVLLILACGALSAHATIKILSVSGASATATNPSNIVTIFGGTAGADCTSSNVDTTNTCNSCVGTVGTACPNSPGSFWPFCACNANRIYDNLIVTITFTSDSTSGNAGIANNSLAGGLFPGAQGSTNIAQGGTSQITIPWNQICGNFVAGSTSVTCEGLAIDGAVTGTIALGISNNGTSLADSTILNIQLLNETSNQVDDCSGGSGAICSFKMVAGTGSASFTESMGDHAFPANTQAVRVFASDQSFGQAAPGLAAVTQDLQIDSNGVVTNSVITGLKNRVPYYFRIGTVDAAGNVFNFISDENITNANYGDCMLPIDANPDDACRYHAVPGLTLNH